MQKIKTPAAMLHSCGNSYIMSASGEIISTTYDSNGNPLTVTNSEGTITRAYDELGRVISKTVTGIGTSTILYDVTPGMPTGCTGEITTDSKGNSNTKIYDRAGRLYQVVSGSDTTTYAYYDNGNRESLTYPNGLTAEYTYYADNSLHTLANMNGGTYLSTYNYAYDANGNLLTVLDIDGTTTYTYDELNRLESVTEPSGKLTEYTFDASGNRATEEVTDAGDAALTTYTYTAQNRLTTATKLLSDGTTNSTYYFYDNTGNTISSHEESFETGSEPTSYYLMLAGYGEGDTFAIYTYDVFNQMLSVSDNDSVSAFSYNAEGLRLGKTVTEDDETTTTVFAYEYSKAVLELDENGDETAYNVYGGDMLISRTTTSDGTLYYLYNGHGDVVQLTDSNGTVVMTYDYDAFGVVTEATGTITNSYMFCGYMYDEETGMYYLNSRYYDPVVARFMSADTYLGQQTDPLSLNLYTYCYNEPLMYSDPSGHTSVPVTLPNGTVVTGNVVNGVTTLSDGSRPPVGSTVTVGNTNYYVATDSSGVGGVSGIAMTSYNSAIGGATVTQNGQTRTGDIVNGATYVDGSRVTSGSTVTVGDTTYYAVADSSGVGGVSGIAMDSYNSAIGGATVTQNGQTQTGDVVNGATYVGGVRVTSGSTVTVGNTTYLAISDPNGIGGVSGVKSTTDVVPEASIVNPPPSIYIPDPNYSSYANAYIQYYKRLWYFSYWEYSHAKTDADRKAAKTKMDDAHIKADDIRRLDKEGKVTGSFYDVPVYDQGEHNLCWAYSQVMIEAYYSGVNMTQQEADARARAIAESVAGGWGDWDTGGWPTNSPDVTLKNKIFYRRHVGDIKYIEETPHVQSINDFNHLAGMLADGPIYGMFSGDSGHMIVMTGAVSAPGHEDVVTYNDPNGFNRALSYGQFLSSHRTNFGMEFIGVLRVNH